MALRVAIVGCGKIADQHLAALARIPDSRVVAVCDREPRMAEQLASRFGIEQIHDDLPTMLQGATPDVVHITTPPQSHLSLALASLAAGCHVYVEKPFTIDHDEASRLVGEARRRGLLLTVGHNYQFTPEMIEMRRLVSDGCLGGPVVHLESHWSYDLHDASFVTPVLGSPDHWVRRLPGQLVQNLVCHGVARLAEFLDEPIAQIDVSLHQSAMLADMGGEELMDELRVLIRDCRNTTAFLCFSTQIAPGLNRLRVCGPRNSIEVDQTSGTVSLLPGRSYKSYLTFVAPPLVSARSHLAQFWRNLLAVARRRRYHDGGLKETIERFHRAISKDGIPPIPYREILLTAGITDAIFSAYRTGIGQSKVDTSRTRAADHFVT